MSFLIGLNILTLFYHIASGIAATASTDISQSISEEDFE